MADKPIPLGTAQWDEGVGALRLHRTGDVLVGHTDRDEPVGVPNDGHMLVVAGTRYGKGVSVVIPNLGIYPGSVVVIDPKGENAMVTARIRGNGSPYGRGRGQKVFLFDPLNIVWTPEYDFADLRACFNPLDLVDPEKPETITLAAIIAESLMKGEDAREPYWKDAPRDLLKAIILHVVSASLYPRERKNLVTVRELLMAGDVQARNLAAMTGGKKKVASGLTYLFAAMRKNPSFGGAVAEFGTMFGDLEANAAKTMSNVQHVAATALDFLEGPGMQQALSRSDFSLSDLKTDPKGVSLYLTLPQASMETHYGVLRMMVSLLTAEMEHVAHQPACGHPVWMILDEFPALRRMRVLENAAAQIAGFGVRMTMVTQTLAQLKDIYKDNWETLIANAGTKLFFGVHDHFSRDYVSKLIGEHEVVRTTATANETSGSSWSRARASGKSTSTNTSESAAIGTPVGPEPIRSRESRSSGSGTSETQTETGGGSQSSSSRRSETLHKRPLLTPDEVGRQFGDCSNPTTLVLVSGRQPLGLKRLPYYRLKFQYDWHRDHARPETLAARLRRERDERVRREAAERARREEAKRQEMMRSQQMAAARAKEIADRKRFEESVRLTAQIMEQRAREEGERRERVAIQLIQFRHRYRWQDRKETASSIGLLVCLAGWCWLNAYYVLPTLASFAWGALFK